MRISDWSSDVCSSDLQVLLVRGRVGFDQLLVSRLLGRQNEALVFARQIVPDIDADDGRTVDRARRHVAGAQHGNTVEADGRVSGGEREGFRLPRERKSTSLNSSN